MIPADGPPEADALSRFALGVADIGNLYTRKSDRQARHLLETAWDLGVRAFDVAPHYGLGLAERRLGQFLETVPRSEAVLSTKAGRLLRRRSNPDRLIDLDNQFVVPADFDRVWDATPAGIHRSLQESLERLRTDHVEVLYVHDPERYGLAESLAAAVPALVELRRARTVRSVGVASMAVEALRLAYEASYDGEALDRLMVAGRYTLLDHSSAPLLADCARSGVTVTAASVFNSGILASATLGAAGRFEYTAAPPHIVDRARTIADVSLRHGTDLPTAALHFPLRSAAVDRVVVGAASAEQVRENVARMMSPPADALWEELQDRGLITPAEPAGGRQ